MVPGLDQRLDQADGASHVSGGLGEHFFKEGRRHKLAAGAGHQEAAGLGEPEAPEIQLLIPPVGRFQGLAALGEGRRVADHQAEPPPGLVVGLDQVEDVGAGGGHLDAVFGGVLPHQGQRLLGDVHALHGLGAVECRVDAEAAAVAAEVQHRPARGVGL